MEARSQPFENVPDARFLSPSPEHSGALERLEHLLRDRKGAGLLTGEYGSGKTTMIQLLHERLDLAQHRVAYLNDPRIGVCDLCLFVGARKGIEAIDGDVVRRIP